MEKKWISGMHSVKAAIASNENITRIYLKNGIVLPPHKYPTEYVTLDFLNRLVTTNHQGVVASIASFKYSSLEEIIFSKPKIILVLDHIQDPQNLGAILRTANAFNVKHLLIPKNRAVEINETVLKIASGGHINLKVARVASLISAIQKLKNENYWIYTTSLDENAVNVKGVQINDKVVLVVGNEHSGVSKSIVNQSDYIIKIPMISDVSSLNVSVATGIFLYLLNSN